MIPRELGRNRQAHSAAVASNGPDNGNEGGLGDSSALP
jgi:hypothetical protein